MVLKLLSEYLGSFWFIPSTDSSINMMYLQPPHSGTKGHFGLGENYVLKEAEIQISHHVMQTCERTGPPAAHSDLFYSLVFSFLLSTLCLWWICCCWDQYVDQK